MSEEKTHETIEALVKETYDEWSKDANFIKDISNREESEFCSLLHHGFGQGIRNKYLWNQQTSIYKECAELGLEHADDMSSYIISKIYRYAKKQIGDKPTTETKTDSDKKEIEQPELEGLNVLDWLELQKEYPLAIESLCQWFKSRYMFDDSPFAGMDVKVEQHTIILTDGTRGVYLNPRDLYDFFDNVELRPFIMPYTEFIPDAEINAYPKCKYIIQSKKSIKEFEDVYESRAEAEIAAFIKTFFFSEVTLAHEKNKAAKK